MQSQRELFERQIALERAELEAMPEEEEAELATVYRAKGFTEAEAETIAARMFKDPEHALDTLVREELGLDPDELGSPWGAAVGSFIAFGDRGRHPGDPVPGRGRGHGVRRRRSPCRRRAVRGRRRREPADGPEPALLGRSAGPDRGRGRDRHVPRRASRRDLGLGPRRLERRRRAARRPARPRPPNPRPRRPAGRGAAATGTRDGRGGPTSTVRPSRARPSPVSRSAIQFASARRSSSDRSSSRRRPSIETIATRPPPATSPTSSSHHWNSAISSEGYGLGAAGIGWGAPAYTRPR